MPVSVFLLLPLPIIDFLIWGYILRSCVGANIQEKPPEYCYASDRKFFREPSKLRLENLAPHVRVPVREMNYDMRIGLISDRARERNYGQLPLGHEVGCKLQAPMDDSLSLPQSEHLIVELRPDLSRMKKRRIENRIMALDMDWTPRLRQSVKRHFAVRCRSIVGRG